MLSQIVTSSNIKQVGHDRDTLFIKFKSSEVYSYDEVPPEVYQQMVDAESAGQYFHKHIKNVFHHSKAGFDPFPIPAAPGTVLYHPLRLAPGM